MKTVMGLIKSFAMGENAEDRAAHDARVSLITQRTAELVGELRHIGASLTAAEEKRRRAVEPTPFIQRDTRGRFVRRGSFADPVAEFERVR